MTLVGTKSTESFSVNLKLNSSPCKLGAAEQLLVSAAASTSAGVLNEAIVNSLLLAALEQFHGGY